LHRNWKWNGVTYRLWLGVTWQQQYGNTNKMQTCWQVCVILQQRVISVINTEVHWYQPQYKANKRYMKHLNKSGLTTQ
jgi:hypothetical protein